jgi:hypothetical protein
MSKITPGKAGDADTLVAELLAALKMARIAAMSFSIRLEPHELAQVDAAIARARGGSNE